MRVTKMEEVAALLFQKYGTEQHFGGTGAWLLVVTNHLEQLQYLAQFIKQPPLVPQNPKRHRYVSELTVCDAAIFGQ